MSGISSIGYAPAFGQSAVAKKNGQVKLDQQEMFAPEKHQEKKSSNLLKDVGIVTCALVGLDFLFFKGKHIKNLL
jgi:hypothetical protein